MLAASSCTPLPLPLYFRACATLLSSIISLEKCRRRGERKQVETTSLRTTQRHHTQHVSRNINERRACSLDSCRAIACTNELCKLRGSDIVNCNGEREIMRCMPVYDILEMKMLIEIRYRASVNFEQIFA